MKTEILSTDTPQLFRAAVERVARELRAGGVAALPTETVYGLAANAFDAPAVSRIYEIKGRPAHNPIIVHVASLDMARRCVARWPALAGKLADAFWPGPLTMVLPRSPLVPDIVTAGGDTVAVRWPSHPFIQAVILECGFPLAAPSANLSNRLSPTNAEHVRSQLGNKLALVVDGGQSQVGIESTVLDLTTDPPRVLRPGMIHLESLQSVTGKIGGAMPSEGLKSGTGLSAGSQTLRSPGLLKKHYSPRAKLIVLSWRDEAHLRKQLSESNVRDSTAHIVAHCHVPACDGWGGVSVAPHDPEAFARALYSELHRCDEAGAETIIVEALPEAAEWHAIADRLKRASAD